MKIALTNAIRIDGELEMIEEQHVCQLTKKGGFDYVVYENTDGEKVVIKFDNKEMVMTRYSSPHTVMRFQKDGLGLASLPTPMGVQTLLTRTHFFEADLQETCLRLTYDLLTHEEAEQPLASYDLSLSLCLD